MHPLRPALLAAAAAVLSAACWRGGSAPAPAAAVTPSAFSDANIAAVVVAANDADISYARIALARGVDARVKGFAQTMINDHTSVNRAASDLVGRLGVTPQDNEASLDLRDDAESKREELLGLEGWAFDSAYVANEVTYHRRVLGAIDGALIPSAQNAELKALLVSVRPAVAAHLGHAEELQRTLRR